MIVGQIDFSWRCYGCGTMFIYELGNMYVYFEQLDKFCW